MTVILWILLGFLGWIILGCGLLALLDDEEGSLLGWAREFPLGGADGFILLWPISLWLIYKLTRR